MAVSKCFGVVLRNGDNVMSSETPPIINVFKDDLLYDDDIARTLGVTRPTVWRYRKIGKDGVKLPYVTYGRRNATTRKCIQWWFEQLQRVEQSPRTIKKRAQVDPALEAECEAAGI